MKKQVKELIADLEGLGYEVELRRGGHYKVTLPGEDGCVFMGATPSDHRAFKNTLGQLHREFGYRPPTKR